MPREHIHFVTGRLAEQSLRRIVQRIAAEIGFDYSIEVLNITVAALMSPGWIASRLSVDSLADRVLLPGYCEGDLTPVQQATGRPVDRGPRDLRRLPEYFGQQADLSQYGSHSIEIIAEINNCPRLPLADILDEAARLSADGADVIDVGCDPGETWSGVGEAVRALVDAGHRVSVDSMNPDEIALAVAAGAQLVLSVNQTNRDAAVDWGCEVVAVPDTPSDLASLDQTIEFLNKHNVSYRVDPVLEPIGFGFARSLQRYLDVRQRNPDVEMMMGIGNLTELTDVDSAGMNVALLGFCEEIGIRSVLTTQVINWAQTAVRECDLARRLVHYAVTEQSLPKHVEPRLVTLRDATVTEIDPDELQQLSQRIKDNNYRIFASGGQVHLVSAGLHLNDSDPFRLFQRLMDTGPTNLDPTHAFYLGYELCKAATAGALSKQYEQDEPLDWGYLTQAEQYNRLSRSRSPGLSRDDDQDDHDKEVRQAD